MATFNRDRFQGAKMASIVDARKDAEKKSGYSQDGRPGFHSIEEGVNLFRIAPPHDPKNPPFQPIRSTWLKCSVPVLDSDYKETGKFEVKNKRIFSSIVHGDIDKDIIETYINYVRNKVNDEVDDKDERAKRLAPITGWKDKNGKWNPGIYPSTNFVFYAWDKDLKLGRIELYPSDIRQMEKLNISEDTGEPIETDQFSDPSEEGLWLSINLFKNEKNKWERVLTKKSFNPQGIKPADLPAKYQEFLANNMVTDEMLMQLAEKESLEEVYGKNSYTKRDFEMALDGLQRFDAENGYGIFENEEFLEEVKEIANWVYSLEEKGSQGDQADSSEPEPAVEEKSKEIPVAKKFETPKEGVSPKSIEELKAKMGIAKSMQEVAQDTEEVKSVESETPKPGIDFAAKMAAMKEAAAKKTEDSPQETPKEESKQTAAPINVQDQLRKLRESMGKK